MYCRSRHNIQAGGFVLLLVLYFISVSVYCSKLLGRRGFGGSDGFRASPLNLEQSKLIVKWFLLFFPDFYQRIKIAASYNRNYGFFLSALGLWLKRECTLIIYRLYFLGFWKKWQ